MKNTISGMGSLGKILGNIILGMMVCGFIQIVYMRRLNMTFEGKKRTCESTDCSKKKDQALDFCKQTCFDRALQCMRNP